MSKLEIQPKCKEHFMDKWIYAHLNIGLPEDLHDRLLKHPEIRWATVARELIIRYLDELEKFKSEQSVFMPDQNKTQ